MKYLLIVSILLSFPLIAETVKDRAENDEVTFVEKDDPYMLKAFEKAKQTLIPFVKKYQGTSDKQNYFLKVGIRDGENVEYFWVGNFSILGENAFSGEIGNRPRLVQNVALGELVKFSRDDIFDWMYFEDNKMHGNFTACAMLVYEPISQQEEFKKTYGLECDIL